MTTAVRLVDICANNLLPRLLTIQLAGFNWDRIISGVLIGLLHGLVPGKRRLMYGFLIRYTILIQLLYRLCADLTT